MTAQGGDNIVFEDRRLVLASEPLASWLGRRKNKNIYFRRKSTAVSRGYLALWEIARGRLYLTRLLASLPDGSPASVDALFENYTDQFFASVKAYAPENAGPGRFAFWYSGPLICPLGKMLVYKHYGYGSIFERELVLCIREGYLIGSRIVVNSDLAKADAAHLTPDELEMRESGFYSDKEFEELLLENRTEKHWKNLVWP